MSRTFLGFGQVPYIGAPSTRSIKLGGISGVVIPLLLQWISYGASTNVPNINVLVDFDNAVCRAMDQIRSVYIDNLASSNPIYVYFPDTGYSLVAKANSEGWYPAFTNAKKIWVIGEGFLNGSIPQTVILLSNIPLPPNVNTEIDQSVALWKASPVITRGTSIYNSALGIPALGDQTTQINFDLNAGGPLGLFGSPYSSGFITLTGLTVNVLNGTNLGAFFPQLVIESTGVAGVLYSFFYLQPSMVAGSNIPLQQIYNKSGLQLKLDATQTWRCRNLTSITNGLVNVIVEYTVGPN